MALEIRPARPGDAEAVLAFCAHIWEGRDYLPRVWAEWLVDPAGVLLVALREGVPVALVRAVLLSPEEAWLEGMRVDPKHRGEGIATALFAALVEELAGRGVRVARLLTIWLNLAVHRMCAHLGFERILRLRPRVRLLEQGTCASVRPLREGELALARSLLERKNIPGRFSPSFLEMTHGLYSLGGGMWSLWNEEQLREHLSRDEVWVWEEAGRPRALAVVCPHRRRPGTYEVGLLEGPSGACTALLDALVLRTEVPAGEPDHPSIVRITLPLEARRLHRTASAAGYYFPRDWRGELWIFERFLR